MLKFSGFYNAKFDPEDVQFAFAPESSLFNPKSLREACGNEPLGTSTIICLWDCGKSKNANKDCCVKRRNRSQELAAWRNCKAAWQASPKGDNEPPPSGGTEPPPSGGTEPPPSGGNETPEKRNDKKNNTWIWVSSIAALFILIIIIALLMWKSGNKKQQ